MNFRFYILLMFFLGISFLCHSQEDKTMYLDDNLQETTRKHASYIGEVTNENGLCRLECRYKNNKKLALVAHFLNSSRTILEGPFSTYFTDHAKQSEGNYNNGKKEGTWNYWNIKGYLIDSIVYRSGKKIQISSFYYYSNGITSHENYTDNASGTFRSVTNNESGEIKREVIQIDTTFYIKTFVNKTVEVDTFRVRKDTSDNKNKTIDTTHYQPAIFQGGVNGWIKFLSKNLDPNVPGDNGAPEGKYMVRVAFLILKNGEVESVRPETDLGFGMEREVMRLIYATPVWIPAIYKGHPSNSYFKQPVTFVLSE